LTPGLKAGTDLAARTHRSRLFFNAWRVEGCSGKVGSACAEKGFQDRLRAKSARYFPLSRGSSLAMH